MKQVPLAGVNGVRYLPDHANGVGALVVAGSSGRVDSARAALLGAHGVMAESIQWFGGEGQNSGPWEIPIEAFARRVTDLAKDCDRVAVVGTSFGAEAALLTGCYCEDVSAVVAFAPSDVVWAGVKEDGTLTSHWTFLGAAVPYVPFDEDWEPDGDTPAFVGLYQSSRERYSDRLGAATIPVERIDEVVLVAGGDDQVWPSLAMAKAISTRRSKGGRDTALVSDLEAGHRAVLPGEQVVTGGIRMRRGGSDEADRRLGAAAWPHLARVLRIG